MAPGSAHPQDKPRDRKLIDVGVVVSAADALAQAIATSFHGAATIFRERNAAVLRRLRPFERGAAICCALGGRAGCRHDGPQVRRQSQAGRFPSVPESTPAGKCNGRTARDRSHGLNGSATKDEKREGEEKMARVTGLEPATSGVTGRHSNQLSYTRAFGRFRGKRLFSRALVCLA